MLVYLWGVGRQERQQKQTNRYGRAPWSGGVLTSPGALGRLQREAGSWRNSARTQAAPWAHPASYRNCWRPDAWCWRWGSQKSFLMIINEANSSSIQIDHLRSLNHNRSLIKKISLNKRSCEIAYAAQFISMSIQKGHWTYRHQELLF